MIRMIPMPTLYRGHIRRFWSKVNKLNITQCWKWMAGLHNGYGTICFNYQAYQAHRISYWIHYRKDPEELLVCHECNNKLCVNPDHLILGTHQDNNQYAHDCGRNSQKGSFNPMAKLCEIDIIEIRKLCKFMSYPQVARRFNVTKELIYQINNGKIWTHIK